MSVKRSQYWHGMVHDSKVQLEEGELTVEVWPFEECDLNTMSVSVTGLRVCIDDTYAEFDLTAEMATALVKALQEKLAMRECYAEKRKEAES
jgi:hypothetical protein